MTERSVTLRNKHRAIIKARHENCGICGQPIDYTLPWPDPMCFVVDHVVPLKPRKGATPGTDTLDNKQAAHNTCNSKKRARVFAPIVRRSGSLG